MAVADANKRQSRKTGGVFKRLGSGPMFRPLSVAIVASVAAVAASLVVNPDMQGLLGALLAIVAIMIALSDWRRFIIPDGLNGAGFLLGLVHAAILVPGEIMRPVETALVRALVAAAVLFVIRAVYAAVRGRQGLGLGDVKLAAVAGVWLDWSVLPVAIELAALSALFVYVLGQLLSGRRLPAQSRIPFGFFFAPAIWICWLLQGEILSRLLGA